MRPSRGSAALIPPILEPDAPVHARPISDPYDTINESVRVHGCAPGMASARSRRNLMLARGPHATSRAPSRGGERGPSCAPSGTAGVPSERIKFRRERGNPGRPRIGAQVCTAARPPETKTPARGRRFRVRSDAGRSGRADRVPDVDFAVRPPHEPVAHAVVGLEDHREAVALVRQLDLRALAIHRHVTDFLARFPHLEHVARLEAVLRAAVDDDDVVVRDHRALVDDRHDRAVDLLCPARAG